MCIVYFFSLSSIMFCAVAVDINPKETTEEQQQITTTRKLLWDR